MRAWRFYEKDERRDRSAETEIGGLDSLSERLFKSDKEEYSGDWIRTDLWGRGRRIWFPCRSNADLSGFFFFQCISLSRTWSGRRLLRNLNANTICSTSRRDERVGRPARLNRISWGMSCRVVSPVISRAAFRWIRSKSRFSVVDKPLHATDTYSSAGHIEVLYICCSTIWGRRFR